MEKFSAQNTAKGSVEAQRNNMEKDSAQNILK